MDNNLRLKTGYEEILHIDLFQGHYMQSDLIKQLCLSKSKPNSVDR